MNGIEMQIIQLIEFQLISCHYFTPDLKCAFHSQSAVCILHSGHPLTQTEHTLGSLRVHWQRFLTIL